MTDTGFNLNWASPPGESITRQMTVMGVDSHDLAEDLSMSLNEVRSVLAGLLPITPEIATVLSNRLGGSKGYWLNRDSAFQHAITALPLERRFERSWVESMPYKAIVKLGWVKPAASVSGKASELLDFFGLRHSAQWRLRYPNSSFASAFRTSTSFNTHPEAVALWLRRGEQVAATIDCAPWNPDGFRASLPDLKALTRNKYPSQFFPELRHICAANGVALVAAPTPEGCHASGATQFLSRTKALLMLSFRFKSDDQFWFSFFHEAGHLILHDIDAVFIDDAFSEKEAPEEAEANHFAQEMLLPERRMAELRQVGRNSDGVMRFARRLGVSSGVVVGQMQKRLGLDPRYLNGLKRRYGDEEIAAVFNL